MLLYSILQYIINHCYNYYCSSVIFKYHPLMFIKKKKKYSIYKKNNKLETLRSEPSIIQLFFCKIDFFIVQEKSNKCADVSSLCNMLYERFICVKMYKADTLCFILALTPIIPLFASVASPPAPVRPLPPTDGFKKG